MPEVTVILELPLVEVLQDTLFLFGRFLDSLIEFILCRVFYFLPFSFGRLRMPWTVHTNLFSGLARGRDLLRQSPACQKAHQNQ